MPICTDLKGYVGTIDKKQAFTRLFSLSSLALTQGLFFVPRAHFKEPDGCSDTPIEEGYEQNLSNNPFISALHLALRDDFAPAPTHPTCPDVYATMISAPLSHRSLLGMQYTFFYFAIYFTVGWAIHSIARALNTPFAEERKPIHLENTLFKKVWRGLELLFFKASYRLDLGEPGSFSTWFWRFIWNGLAHTTGFLGTWYFSQTFDPDSAYCHSSPNPLMLGPSQPIDPCTPSSEPFLSLTTNTMQQGLRILLVLGSIYGGYRITDVIGNGHRPWGCEESVPAIQRPILPFHDAGNENNAAHQDAAEQDY